jgi:lysyl endopeptidase
MTEGERAMRKQFKGQAARAWAVAALAAAVLAGCGGGAGVEGAAATAAASGEGAVPSIAQSLEAAAPQLGAARALVLQPARILLEAVDEMQLQASAPLVGARQIGEARQVPATDSLAGTARQWRWQPTPQGGQVAALSFTAKGAHGLRLGVLVSQLPAEAVLRVYSQERRSAVYETTGAAVLQGIARNVAADGAELAARVWWTPDAGGDEATLEVELPAGLPTGSVQLAVPQLSHVFEDLSLPTADEWAMQTKLNESEACQLDASCYADYDSVSRAVARMTYVKNGQGYLCTGTLLADRGATRTPYFLSANHCISTQTVASTLQTYWFYRAPSCNSRTLSSSTVTRSGGATLLYASNATDTSFLRLNDTPPTGAVFAGWDPNPQPVGTEMVGVHHPRGDLQKISFGRVSSMAQCTVFTGTSFSCQLGATGNYYRVAWSEGIVEGGSSGSGLFKNKLLVGTLYGGSSSCTGAGTDAYGRFDVPYQAAIKQWLSPESTPTPTPTPTPDPAPTGTAGTAQGWLGLLQGLPGINANQPIRLP